MLANNILFSLYLIFLGAYNCICNVIHNNDDKIKKIGFTIGLFLEILITIGLNIWSWDIYLKNRCKEIYINKFVNGWKSIEISIFCPIGFIITCIFFIIGKYFYNLIYNHCKKMRDKRKANKRKLIDTTDEIIQNNGSV